jgi:putative ABC transport system permease protein
MVLWKFTTREIRNRPGRAILTLLSIVIGVAAVVAVSISTRATNDAYKQMFEAVTGKAALEVMPDDETSEKPWFADTVVPKLEKVAGVKSAIPLIQRSYQIYFNKKKPVCMLYAIDPKRSETFDNYQLTEGEFFKKESENEVILEAGFARGLGAKVGDEIKVRGVSLVGMKLIGTLKPKNAANWNQGGVVFMPLDTAQSLISAPGYINRVSLILQPNANEDVVRANIQSRLPKGMKVVVPAARSQLAKENPLKMAEIGLWFAFFLSFAVAIFMILNTFIMNVGERRRQLSILRAIGTTRGQIMKMLLTEGLAMGILGTALGIAFGVGGAFLLTNAMTRMFEGTSSSLTIGYWPFVFALLVGPSISLLGVFIPAHLAGRITPLEGMRPIVSEAKSHISYSYLLFSVSVFLLTGAALGACIVGWLPVLCIIPIGVLFTIAFVLLIPIVLRQMSVGTSYLLYPILKTEGVIASRQILRRRVRTTLTIGILYMAVSTAVSMGTSIINNVNDIYGWYQKAMVGDFFIRPVSSSQMSAANSSVLMDESMAKEIRRIQGVTNLDSIRYVSANVSSPIAKTDDDIKNAKIVVRDFTDKGPLPLDITEGKMEEVRRGLTQGDVVLGSVLANRTHTSLGGQINIETPAGMKRFRIAGIANVYLVGGMVVYMEGDRARQLMGVQGADMFVVQTDGKNLPTVEKQLKDFCDNHGIMLQSLADLRIRIDSLINGAVAGLWGLMVLGYIVGVFAMANTLSMNVLEQTRELALLRVVAMTRRQVRKTILAQATIIGVIGLLVGSAGGLVGSWTMNLCSIPLFGKAVSFSIHPWLLLSCFAGGLFVILLSAWIPAERAARLNLLIALQYE